MSGVPFNPMRKEPPPPPHTDTVSFHPDEYVVLRSCDHHEFFVHRECLRESALLRRAFAKRQHIALEDLTVTFHSRSSISAQDSMRAERDGEDDDAALDGAADSMARSGGVASPLSSNFRGEKSGARSASLPFAAAAAEADAALAAGGKVERASPLVLSETLHVDASVRLHFPGLDAATLETVIAYLYYKHRYERRPTEVRSPFTVPDSAAIAVMKIAHLLEC